jgi:hypothetical protein
VSSTADKYLAVPIDQGTAHSEPSLPGLAIVLSHAASGAEHAHSLSFSCSPTISTQALVSDEYRRTCDVRSLSTQAAMSQRPDTFISEQRAPTADYGARQKAFPHCARQPSMPGLQGSIACAIGAKRRNLITGWAAAQLHDTRARQLTYWQRPRPQRRTSHESISMLCGQANNTLLGITPTQKSTAANDEQTFSGCTTSLQKPCNKC